ncbi:HAMP domain-containing histidine kinase [Ramlibacter sp. AW1]|uniref:histidine kinase n=1 Tax=Ramlibacter aurantiacus TaxID=2801330 RepID=A0A936ZIS6_9BURK|nr:HAMP domain-containing sensor histidine kinase [Ramlibacter aurantiacus]MBL0421677.1 HAMP domain-containing histidine kinase [Ramlibacter aurantiacus]
MRSTPSIRARLSRTLLAWSILWMAAVSGAVWLAVQHEIDEQLDDRLEAAADMLGAVIRRVPIEGWRAAAEVPVSAEVDIPFDWQLIDSAGHLVLRSALAPMEPFQAVARFGLGSAGGWRIFGRMLDSGHILYVAHERRERREAQLEVALSASLAALAMALVGHVWLRARFWQELRPLQALSERLAAHDPAEGPLRLGPAQRSELEPLQHALDVLSERLADRIRREAGFSAHAAHAMRTPLAGIDAQISIALREAPTTLQPRLQRVRDAAQRLQHVVAALLGLFRTDGGPRRVSLELDDLVASLPGTSLAVEVRRPARIEADADLLTAALINLIDNAQRHGARSVMVSVPRPQVLRVDDDGHGLEPAQRENLERALAEEDYEAMPGLGLVLADVVARVHGGDVALPVTGSGFSVEMRLAAPGDEAVPGA